MKPSPLRITVPPGWFIKDALKYIGLTQKEFARLASYHPKTVSYVVNGKSPITSRMAASLEQHTGIPFSIWMQLQRQHEQNTAMGALEWFSAILEVHARSRRRPWAPSMGEEGTQEGEETASGLSDDDFATGVPNGLHDAQNGS